MKSNLTRALVLLALGFLLGGCASFEAEVERGRSLKGVQRFFVVRNLNDNHALDQNIVAALKARGFEADFGPLTMMADNAQAVVSFQDSWSWDFGEHLVFMKLVVREPYSNKMFATVTFSASVPLRKPYPDIVDALVDRLFTVDPNEKKSGPREEHQDPADKLQDTRKSKGGAR